MKEEVHLSDEEKENSEESSYDSEEISSEEEEKKEGSDRFMFDNHQNMKDKEFE